MDNNILKNAIPFTVAPKNIKHLSINLTKMSGICMMKIIRCWWKKCKVIWSSEEAYCVHGLEDSIKMSIFLIDKFNVIPMKISVRLFVDIVKIILKFMWNKKEIRIANAVLKKNKIGGISVPDFKKCSYSN